MSNTDTTATNRSALKKLALSFVWAFASVLAAAIFAIVGVRCESPDCLAFAFCFVAAAIVCAQCTRQIYVRLLRTIR
jgi:hypothetical protein